MRLTPKTWETWTWMSCPCLETCWGQAQLSWTKTDCPVRAAAVRAVWAPWPWTVRMATGQVCLRTPAGAPSAGKPARMTSAFSLRTEMTFWGMLLPGETEASVSPAVAPYPRCGKAITQACLGLCPGKADGEVSGSKFWNSFLAFIVQWKRKRVAFDVRGRDPLNGLGSQFSLHLPRWAPPGLLGQYSLTAKFTSQFTAASTFMFFHCYFCVLYHFYFIQYSSSSKQTSGEKAID